MPSSASASSSVKSISSSSPKGQDDEIRIQKAEKRFAKLQKQVQLEKERQKDIDTQLQKILKDAKANLERKHPQKHKKVTITDNDCADMEDMIMRERIPKKYAIYLDQQCYDARTLWPWIEQKGYLPHNRNMVTDEKIRWIKQKYQAWEKEKQAPVTEAHIASSVSESEPSTQSESTSTSQSEHHNIPELTPSTISNIAGFYATDILINPNDTEFALVDNREQIILDANTFRIVGRQNMPITNIPDLYSTIGAWSPDGTKLAIGVSSISSLTIRVYDRWDLQTPQQTHSIHAGHLFALSWSPNGHMIAFGTLGGIVQILDANTMENVKDLLHVNRAIETVKWSPDGSHIAVVAITEQKLYIWETERWELKRTLTRRSMGFPHRRTFERTRVTNISWSPDSTKIAVTLAIDYDVATARISVWDWINDREIVKRQGTLTSTIEWNPVYNLIITADENDMYQRSLTVWNASTLQPVYRMEFHKTVRQRFQQPNMNAGYIEDVLGSMVAWSADGTTVLGLIAYNDRDRYMRCLNKWNIPQTSLSVSGGSSKVQKHQKQTYTYHGRKYVVRVGSRGGTYILVGTDKKKIYVSSPN